MLLKNYVVAIVILTFGDENIFVNGYSIIIVYNCMIVITLLLYCITYTTCIIQCGHMITQFLPPLCLCTCAAATSPEPTAAAVSRGEVLA